MEGSGDVNAGKMLPWSSDLFIGGRAERERERMCRGEREKES